MSSGWVTNYFDRKDLEKYSPEVVLEGKKMAILRITNATLPKQYRSVGYILVKKNGHFSASTHISLHEGVATATDMAVMAERLNQEDGKV